jgi:hypothetical protein
MDLLISKKAAQLEKRRERDKKRRERDRKHKMELLISKKAVLEKRKIEENKFFKLYEELISEIAAGLNDEHVPNLNNTVNDELTTFLTCTEFILF